VCGESRGEDQLDRKISKADMRVPRGKAVKASANIPDFVVGFGFDKINNQSKASLHKSKQRQPGSKKRKSKQQKQFDDPIGA